MLRGYQMELKKGQAVLVDLTGFEAAGVKVEGELVVRAQILDIRGNQFIVNIAPQSVNGVKRFNVWRERVRPLPDTD